MLMVCTATMRIISVSAGISWRRANRIRGLKTAHERHSMVIGNLLEKRSLQSFHVASCRTRSSISQASRSRWRQNCKGVLCLSAPSYEFHRMKSLWFSYCLRLRPSLGRVDKACSLCSWASLLCHRVRVIREWPRPKHRQNLLWW